MFLGHLARSDLFNTDLLQSTVHSMTQIMSEQCVGVLSNGYVDHGAIGVLITGLSSTTC